MYSREDFTQRFRNVETDELLERMATTELSDDAREAMLVVFRERGLRDEELDERVKQAKRLTYRRTGVTNGCDNCGKHAGRNAIRDAGQKFCSRTCWRAARLNEAAVDVREEDVQRLARDIRDGRCPRCGRRSSPVEVRQARWVWSALFLTRWGTTASTCCKSCGDTDQLVALLKCLALGWWGFPWGLLITPVQMLANIVGLLQRRDPPSPTHALVEVARMKLAAQLLDAPALRK